MNATDSPDAGHPLIKKVAASSVPVEQLLGISISEIGEGRAVGALQARPEHANPMGTLQGGILCSLADATMGMAFASTLQSDESFTTMNLQIHFFRPVWDSQLRAEARVVQRSKNTGYVECEITDAASKRIAKASCTCLVLRGDLTRKP
ncbi:MAG: PaaI family thioesterase [Candidatus Acidiferrales bacterium]|jgi:uncharacterized protein (TIGR00369 family)